MPNRAGSPNKNKQFLIKRLQDMYGEDFDPIINAAENALRMNALAKEAQELPEDMTSDQLINAKTLEFDRRKDCVAAWDKIAQYVTPKLKAVEIDASLELVAHESWLDLLPLEDNERN